MCVMFVKTITNNTATTIAAADDVNADAANKALKPHNASICLKKVFVDTHLLILLTTNTTT